MHFFTARIWDSCQFFCLHSFTRACLHWHACYVFFFLGASTRESRYTWLLLIWSLSSILLSCQSDWAFQESEHAIIRLLGDCGRIRTSLRCTIAAKSIHSHDLAPLTLLNTVEMRPFKIPYFSPSVSSLHFDSRMRCSTFLRGFVFLQRIL